MWNIIDAVNEIDPLALTGSSWFDYPVFTAFMALHFFRELSELLRKDESFRDEGEVSFAMNTLHSC